MFAVAAIVGVVVLLVIYLIGQNSSDDSGPSTATPTFTEQPDNAGVRELANAIAYAEGFGISGAIPTMAHNPGDLKIPNWQGQTLGSGISVFSSDSEGWSRLYHQLNLIVRGQSSVYNIAMSISEMAQKWTATNPNDWANNVANRLGVAPDTGIDEIIIGVSSKMILSGPQI